MTTDDLTTGLPAATRQRLRTGALRLFCCAALCVAGTTAAFAQTAPVANAIDDAEIVVDTDVAAQAVEAKADLHRIRPIFGDLAELDPGTVVKAEAQKPGISDRIQNVLAKAFTLLGTPYVWGGESTDGFDCSGLVGYVYRTVLGMDLPRVSRQMVNSGEAVERAKLAPGDLVFFGLRGRVNHVGIYVGEGRFVHAPSRGKDVRVDSLSSSYWSGRYMQGRRVAM